MGRKRIHESDSDRVAFYRSQQARLDVSVKHDIDATLTKIAKDLDVSKNELIKNLINFSLLNRNWSVTGLMSKK